MKTYVFGLALLLSGCGSTERPAQAPPSVESHLLNAPLPAIERRTLAGESFATSTLQGRKVVVKFFAKYCEPCKRTLPAVQALHERKPEIAFVGVSEDDGPNAATEVVRMYHLSFPVVLDADHVLAGRFRVSEMPVTFVTDASGVVRWVGGPGTSEQDLVAAIEAVP